MENKAAEILANLIADAIMGPAENAHTTRMLNFNNAFFDVVRLDADKIATLQQEEANTTLYCGDPNCIACQVHLKALVAKHREVLILIDTVLRPYKKQFATLFGEIAQLTRAGEAFVRHIEGETLN